MQIYKKMMMAAGLLLIAGCGSGSGNGPVQLGQVTSAPRSFGPLQFTLSIAKPPARFNPGEPVPMTVTVRNTGAAVWQGDILCPGAEIQVSSSGQEIAHLPGGGCSGGTGLTLQPGQTMTTTYTWDQTDLQGHPVPPGVYTIKGWYDLSATNSAQSAASTNMATNPITIDIT